MFTIFKTQLLNHHRKELIIMRAHFINILGVLFLASIILILTLSPIYAQTLPEGGDINSNINVGLAPLIVKFTLKDASFYQRWDFGDGTKLDERNPTHIYTKPGAYTVKVIYRNRDGKFQIQKENLITVYEPTGLCKLVPVQGSGTRPGQTWDNAVDGDIYFEDGTASPNAFPFSAKFGFIDSAVKRVVKIRVLGDTKTNWHSKVMKEFRVLYSNGGLEDSDFVLLWHGTTDDGSWLQKEILPTDMKYIKFIIDKPEEEWRQVGEIEVYSEVIFVDSLLSTLTATGPHVADGVEMSKIILTLKDQDGNPVTGKTENDITFLATGEANKFSNFHEVPNTGEYCVELTSLSAGEKKVTAFVNGVPVQYISINSSTRATTVFTQPEYGKGQFIIIDSSRTLPGENWSNAFDGDIDDSDGYMDGTVGCTSKPSFMTFEFADHSIHWINKMRLLTDTKRGFKLNWADHFQLLVSTTGLNDEDFTQILSADKHGGRWEDYVFAAVPTKYIKFIVDKPVYRWRQIGELEIYVVPEPTPVELATFEVRHINGENHLIWTTASETKNYGFEIEHRFTNTAFETIGFVRGAGTTSETQHYRFVDTKLTGESIYYYRLKQVDTDGTFFYSEEVMVSIGALANYDLAQNYPNPFNPTTIIHYQLPKAGFTTLTITNMLGQEIKHLVRENLKAGKYQAIWDSTNDNGLPIAAGVYFYRIRSNDFVLTKRMTLLK